MIRVKVCGLNDPVNTREVLRAGADFLGFIFYPGSRRYVGDNPVDLFRDLPLHARKIGVFVDEDPGKVIEVTGKFSLYAVQLHGHETPVQCRAVRQQGIRVIKAFGIGGNFEFSLLAGYVDVCDYFLFDSQTRLHGGSGLRFPWQELGKYSLDKPFFLSGGIEPGDAGTIRGLSHKSLFAADINSRFETEPGIKDTRIVKDFISDIKNRAYEF